MTVVSVNVPKVELVCYLGVNVGWDVGINVSVSVGNDFVGKLWSGNYGWSKLKVEDESYSGKGRNFSKDVNMKLIWKLMSV